jgi:hypothetical protein
MFKVAVHACARAGLAAAFTHLSPLAVGAASCTYELAFKAAGKIGQGTLSALVEEAQRAPSVHAKFRASCQGMTCIVAAMSVSAYAAMQAGQRLDPQLSVSQMLALGVVADLCGQVFEKLTRAG